MCFGIAGCLVYSPATAVAGHWFLKKRSTAVGIIVAGSGLGGVIYPIMLKELLEKLCKPQATAPPSSLTRSLPRHAAHHHGL